MYHVHASGHIALTAAQIEGERGNIYIQERRHTYSIIIHIFYNSFSPAERPHQPTLGLHGIYNALNLSHFASGDGCSCRSFSGGPSCLHPNTWSLSFALEDPSFECKCQNLGFNLQPSSATCSDWCNLGCTGHRNDLVLRAWWARP